MSAYRSSFRLLPRRRRTLISYLFTLTALGSFLTVATSDILPCPAHRPRFADGHDAEKMSVGGKAVVEKRPRRWIEERNPTQ